jgi:hypothetical protein
MGTRFTQPLDRRKNRHEWKLTHGYRKYFEANAQAAGMNHLNIELLMGHDTGLVESYYKPEEMAVLEDYLKAVDFLTINSDKITLQKQVAELTEKNKEENYIIKGKLAEKEKKLKNQKGG